MDIVVSGRRCEVSDRFKEHVEEKLARLEKHDHRLIRIEVEVENECSSRPDRACRVELTARSRGPVVRAEAAAEDKRAALDLAVDKMAAQMRRSADRRKVHRGQRTPTSVHEAMASTASNGVNGTAVANGAEAETDAVPMRRAGSVLVEGDGPLVVREKVHTAAPMSLDQALHEMELVGHDFYLYVDDESRLPSVVYRRHGYDYGVIALTTD